MIDNAARNWEETVQAADWSDGNISVFQTEFIK